MMFGPGTRAYHLLHELGHGLHETLARHPRWAERWLSSLALLRRAPSGSYKAKISNSVAAVRWPELAIRPQRVTVGTHTEIRLRPHPGEFDFEALLRSHLLYEVEVFRWLEGELRKYDVVVEIGANVGVFSVFMDACKRADGLATPRILSFEPSRLAFTRLLDNLALNRAEVEAFNCAIGARSGIADFYEPAGHLTNGSLDPQFARLFSGEVRRCQVLVISSEQIAALVGPCRRPLLKIDVEGAEAEVLSGLEPWVRAAMPDIILEVLPAYESSLRERDYLVGLGYRFYRFEAAGAVGIPAYAADLDHRDQLALAPRL